MKVNTNLTIYGKFESLNKILAAAKSSPEKCAALKRNSTKTCVQALIHSGCVPKTPYDTVRISYTFHEKRGSPRDPDNILSGFTKSFLDAMVCTGVIEDDDIYTVKYGSVDFVPDAKDFRVEISWEVE